MLKKQIFSLSDNDIAVQILPNTPSALFTSTNIHVGASQIRTCFSNSEEASTACCEKIAEEKSINWSVYADPSGSNNWRCKYSDIGTGDWN